MISVKKLERPNQTIVSQYISYYKYIFEDEPHKDISIYIQALINEKHSSIYKIMIDEIQIGFFSCQEVFSTALMGKTIEIIDFWILEEYRSKGAGTEVTQKIFKITKFKNYKAIELFTAKENFLANKFWTSVGFTESSLQHYRKLC